MPRDAEADLTGMTRSFSMSNLEAPDRSIACGASSAKRWTIRRPSRGRRLTAGTVLKRFRLAGVWPPCFSASIFLRLSNFFVLGSWDVQTSATLKIWSCGVAEKSSRQQYPQKGCIPGERFTLSTLRGGIEKRKKSPAVMQIVR
jgi:hypothetical protein